MSTPPEGSDQIPEVPVQPADAQPPFAQPLQQPPVGQPPYGQPPVGGSPQPPYGQVPTGAYPPSPAYAGAVPPAPPLRPDEERLWATLAHVGGILFSFVAPLVIWLVFKGRSQFTDNQSKEALNFQITVAIGYVIGTILTIIVIGAILILVVWVLAVVFGIMGAVSANQGKPYRYPICIRFIK